MLSNLSCHRSGLTSLVFMWKHNGDYYMCEKLVSSEQWQLKLDAIFAFGVCLLFSGHSLAVAKKLEICKISGERYSGEL